MNVFQRHPASLRNGDALGPQGTVSAIRSDPVYHKISEMNYVGNGCADGDSAGTRDEHPSGGGVTADGDRLGDGDATKTARVKRVDFTTCSGFADRARKRLARRRARAWVGVIADTGNPGARSLRIRSLGERGECGDRKDSDGSEPEGRVAHEASFVREREILM